MRTLSILCIAVACAAVLNTTATAGSAEAKRVFARGTNGAAGAWAAQGQYGSRYGARILTPTAGAGASKNNLAGPNGGTFQNTAKFGYKKGVGAFRKNQWSGTTPAGGNGAGYVNSQYNAQTGQGTRQSGVNYTNPSGQQYGYDGNTTYTRGQGGTTSIDTQNNGTYNVDWQQGTKPVVTTEP